MNTALPLHPLTYLDDDGDVVVGRRDIDRYVILPTDGAALLRRLEGGQSPAEAAQWYADTYGEPIDMVDFVDTLTEFGFVRDSLEDTTPPAVRFQGIGRALFSRPVWACYLLLVVAAVAAALDDRTLIPNHSDVFFTESLVVIELTLMVAALPFTLLHELFHVLAGRRLGLHSRVRLGNRFYYLVFETVMDGLVSVPRRQRYLPMLAGLLADILSLASFICLAWLLRGPAHQLPAADFTAGLLMAMAFATLPRMAWQCYFFLRTDGYYLVATVTGCQNLHEAAWWRVRTWVARASRGRFCASVGDGSQFVRRDLQVSTWYAPLMLVGYLLALLVLVVVMVPLAWQFFGLALGRLLAGPSADTAAFLDSAVILAVSVGQLALAGYLGLRRRIRSTPDPIQGETP